MNGEAIYKNLAVKNHKAFSYSEKKTYVIICKFIVPLLVANVRRDKRFEPYKGASDLLYFRISSTAHLRKIPVFAAHCLA